MKKYSQNDEDQILRNQFEGKKEQFTILSLGENDGKTLSNSLALIEEGQNAVLIEPSKEAFKKLKQLHKGNKKVKCYNYGIAEETKEYTFYESGTHLNTGDTALLSTIDFEETKRQNKEEFIETKINCKTFKDFYNESKFKTFDVISIDIEGADYQVLTQINLEEVGCKMLVIEFNGKEKEKYIDYCKQFDLNLIHSNYENLIFAHNTYFKK